IVGILEDVEQAMTFHFRQPDRDILVLCAPGAADPGHAEAEFGSSEYAKEILGEVWGTPPALDLKQEAALQKWLRELIHTQAIESAHDVSDGGLAVALAESAFPLNIGVEVDLTSKGSLPEVLLFREDASRVLITCDQKNTENIKRTALQWGLQAVRIGRTVPKKLEIRVDNHLVVSAVVSELRQVWDTALVRALHAETREHLVPETLQKS
ncbi:MAG TPA: AIR synthase-related protein, partial [Candidatus Angelobacter sp.]|nr:AIR synthase-related protein [Candidatus Angelobacter sp.]